MTATKPEVGKTYRVTNRATGNLHRREVAVGRVDCHSRAVFDIDWEPWHIIAWDYKNFIWEEIMHPTNFTPKPKSSPYDEAAALIGRTMIVRNKTSNGPVSMIHVNKVAIYGSGEGDIRIVGNAFAPGTPEVNYSYADYVFEEVS